MARLIGDTQYQRSQESKRDSFHLRTSRRLESESLRGTPAKHDNRLPGGEAISPPLAPYPHPKTKEQLP